MNIMTEAGHKAKIEYDPELDMFRGEILGLSGGADFYGKTPEELRLEFKKSLQVFFEVCKEQGIEPYKKYSGKFNLRLTPAVHAEIAARAAAAGKSLNQWVAEMLEEIIHAS
jgi:predicted HicB family RNase H-like nuclease